MRQYLVVGLLLAWASMAPFSKVRAQTIVGKWKAFENNKPSSIIEIFKGNDQEYYGKMVVLLDPELKKNRCDKCSGDRKGKGMQNLVIIRDLKANENLKEAKGGKILDPFKGKEYNCKIWVDGNTLKMRAYIGFLYGTRTWHKVN